MQQNFKFRGLFILRHAFIESSLQQLKTCFSKITLIVENKDFSEMMSTCNRLTINTCPGDVLSAPFDLTCTADVQLVHSWKFW